MVSARIAREISCPNAGYKIQCSKYEREITNKTNNETLTKAIFNKGFRYNSNILPRIKFCVTEKEKSPQSISTHSQTDSV